MKQTKKSQIIIPAGTHPWSHELRVANILALAGHTVEFLPTGAQKTADILLDEVEYEIKSPKTNNTNSLEHLLKKALGQSPNIIIDTSRMKNAKGYKIHHFLLAQAKSRKRIKRLLLVTKRGEIVDISSLT